MFKKLRDVDITYKGKVVSNLKVIAFAKEKTSKKFCFQRRGISQNSYSDFFETTKKTFS